MYGVTTEALRRVLERKEIDEMNFPGGFEPHQAYDGFISKLAGATSVGFAGRVTERGGSIIKTPHGISENSTSV